MRAMVSAPPCRRPCPAAGAAAWASPSSPSAPVAVGRAAAPDHHVAVFLFGHAGHAAGHLLEAPAVGGADLGQEIDVAAGGDAAIQVARQHRLLLLLGHRPLVEVGALVGLEARAVLGLHQRHAELVQPVALARLLGVEDRSCRERPGRVCPAPSGGLLGPVQAHRVRHQQACAAARPSWRCGG